MVEAYTSLPTLAWAFNSVLIGYLALLYSIGWLDYQFIVNDTRATNYVTTGYIDAVSTGMYNTLGKVQNGVQQLQNGRRELIADLEEIESADISVELRRRLSGQLRRRLIRELNEESQ